MDATTAKQIADSVALPSVKAIMDKIDEDIFRYASDGERSMLLGRNVKQMPGFDKLLSYIVEDLRASGFTVVECHNDISIRW